MAKFEIVFLPLSCSPLIREMHRQTRYFMAENLREARRMVKVACPDGADDSGEWRVDSLREVAA